jgi:hypothetical protein
MPLKDISVRKAKAGPRPRKLSDGGGLHVLIQPTGSKLWRLAYRFSGKQKTLAGRTTWTACAKAERSL